MKKEQKNFTTEIWGDDFVQSLITNYFVSKFFYNSREKKRTLKSYIFHENFDSGSSEQI